MKRRAFRCNPALSPGGHLLSCCGFELEGNPVLDFGDVRNTAGGYLLSAANADMIVQAIAEIGPLFLRRLLEKEDPTRFSPRPFGSVCEACHSVVGDPAAVEMLRRRETWLGCAVLWRRARTTENEVTAA